MHRTLFAVILASAGTPAVADSPRRAVDDASLSAVTFAEGSTRLTSGAREHIEDIAAWHTGHPNSLLVLEGHASPAGSPERNLRISQERTERVRDALVRAGADPGRMVLVARGENQTADQAEPTPRVVVRATGRFVELAKEQRDAETGEDARARRERAARESETNGGAQAPSGGPAPGPADGAATPGAPAAVVAPGSTVVVVPGGAAPLPPVDIDRIRRSADEEGDSAFRDTDANNAGGAGRTSGGLGTDALTGTGVEPTYGGEVGIYAVPYR